MNCQNISAFVLAITLIFPLTSVQIMAQTASEVPLKDPEVLAPPAREKGTIQSTQAVERMTFSRLAEIVLALDENAKIGANGIVLTVSEVPITIVADVRANRMRAFSAFKTLDGIDGQQLYRMMQANFDSALDARYAIARGHLISVFIHPLAELQKDQFIEGLGQVANLVTSFGSAYTSGAMTFGGGDSNAILRKKIDELLEKGRRI